MTYSIDQNARAVMLPAFDRLDISEVVRPFLLKGGHALLIGESRAEYVARAMSQERLNSETVQGFRAAIESLKDLCPNLIVAVDQELGGIQRLEGLVPSFPSLEEARSLGGADLAERCRITALAAKTLGVTMFLAPIADIADTVNPWLRGRTMGSETEVVARLVAAFVTGVQAAGVTAVTKHFPGFFGLSADPALTDVSLQTKHGDILDRTLPFTAAIEAGTKAVMTGPAPVAAIDGENAASTSPKVMAMLRENFGFTGLIVSDDLDAPATMRGRSLLETSIASLNAGADLLLVAGGTHIEELCNGIADATRNGLIAEGRLAEAAGRVRNNALGA